MKRLCTWWILMRIMPLIACTVTMSCVTARSQVHEHVHMEFSSEDVPTYFKEFNERNYRVDRFVLVGSSIDEWTTAVEIITMPKSNKSVDPKALFSAMKEARHKYCPNAEVDVIEQDQQSIL